MKGILVLLVIVISFFISSCAHDTELNSISFNISKDIIVDSLTVATTLIDKMDKGGGASCFISGNEFYFSGKNMGFTNIEIDKALLPNFCIEPLSFLESQRIVGLVLFLRKNNVDGIVKRFDKIYFFPYKQVKLNPSNDFVRYRSLVYLKEPEDTLSSFFNKNHIIDRFKNIRLLQPE